MPDGRGRAAGCPSRRREGHPVRRSVGRDLGRDEGPSGCRDDAQLDQHAPGLRTVEHWRGATLPMGLLYERAAVAFWRSVADKVAWLDPAIEPDGREAG